MLPLVVAGRSAASGARQEMLSVTLPMTCMSARSVSGRLQPSTGSANGRKPDRSSRDLTSTWKAPASAVTSARRHDAAVLACLGSQCRCRAGGRRAGIAGHHRHANIEEGVGSAAGVCVAAHQDTGAGGDGRELPVVVFPVDAVPQVLAPATWTPDCSAPWMSVTQSGAGVTAADGIIAAAAEVDRIENELVAERRLFFMVAESALAEPSPYIATASWVLLTVLVLTATLDEF